MSGTSAPLHSRLPEILEQHEAGILQKWMNEQLSSLTRRRDLIKESEVRDESKAFLGEFRSAVQNHAPGDINAPGWAEMRTLLAGISRSRGARGFTPVETASFIFSLRGTLMDQLQASYGADAAGLAAEMQVCNLLLDKLGLFTTETALATREQVIKRQQEEMLELSTPVVRLCPGVLALPLIGTSDSARTQVVMENLLRSDRANANSGVRHHRHYRRSDGGHGGGPASAQDRRRRASDGRRLHHQRHSPANRADHRSSGRRSQRT